MAKNSFMELILIQQKIYEIRGSKVMLDFDLAELYGTETRILKQAVKRNEAKFPKHFMFQLKRKEWQKLITSGDNLPDTVNSALLCRMLLRSMGYYN
jgi:ORF6N domain